MNIKCEMWKVFVCDGALDMVHGGGSYIEEFYVPKYNISFNIVNHKINVFKTYDERYHSSGSEKQGDFKIPEKLAKTLKSYLEIRKKMQNEVLKCVGDLK